MGRVFAFLLFFTFTSRAAADAAPLVPVPTGEDRINTLKAAAPAPYDGQLFDTPTAIRWANYLHQCTYRLTADVEGQKKLDAIDENLVVAELALEKRQYDLVTHDLQTRLTKAEDELAHPPFYREVWFGVTVGVVLTVGMVAVAAVALNAVK